MRRLWIAAFALGALAPATAEAFCGFYINGAGGEMFNNATQVVLMRDGTRTVLSMANNYQGPPADFAMVVPVPVVLHKDDVKTLSRDLFARVDTMGAPRLVEYWEQDPCAGEERELGGGGARIRAKAAVKSKKAASEPEDYGVTVEAQFEVGEYQIVILSALESTGLDRYLRDQRYQIPAGAAPLLRPYVEGGSKFFVAKVDPKKVTFVNGQAQLSPLRFHYDSDELRLPIRLGLANSAGVQDLIVNVIARGQRYEAANYKNVTIPTNLDVVDDVRARFGEFYASLFDRTLQQNPGAVVTEYSWDAGTCDPCPGPTLSGADLILLGADVIGAGAEVGTMRRGRGRGGRRSGFVLTRLHARYGKGTLPDDLVFRAAPPIAGGREERVASGHLEHGATPAPTNNFQGRYAIRHPWTGAITCDNPQRGRWGRPPRELNLARGRLATAVRDTAFAPRGGVQLPNLVKQDIPEIAIKQGVALRPEEMAPAFPAVTPVPGGASFTNKPQGCGCGASGETGPAFGLLALAFLVRPLRRRSDRV